MERDAEGYAYKPAKYSVVKKKKAFEQTVTPKDASDLELFQSQHGEAFQKITAHPAFLAGLQLLNLRAFNELNSLSFDEIDKYGLLILSVLIGRMKHEHDMLNLHKEQTFTFPTEDEEVIYMSPEEQSAHEQLRARFQEEERKKRYG